MVKNYLLGNFKQARVEKMNKGKKFEQNFRKSVPNNIFYYRLKDSNNNWARNDNIRFASSNVCDSIMFDGQRLYLLELKNHKGKSIPLTCIRENQLRELALKSVFRNVVPCIIINFEDLEECYCLFIEYIMEFIRKADRKSIPIEYCRENGIKIDMVILKTNYKYNVGKFLKDLE